MYSVNVTVFHSFIIIQPFEEPEGKKSRSVSTISRMHYAHTFGPTVGDKVDIHY